MKILLDSIEIINFKGIKSLSIKFGKETQISGENETGKTRIIDAYNWVLFGKDTKDRKDYEIKCLDEDNNVIHGQENFVKLNLILNGKAYSFTRIYAEKWTKKTGEADRVLTGHTTYFFINGVEVKKKDYDDDINDKLDETMFKLLSINNYFNVYIDWKKRREIIMDMFANKIPSDAEIINSKEKLKILSNYISEKDIETIIKEIKARKTLLNKEIKEIPIRIDEIKKNEKESEVDVEAINKQVAELKVLDKSLDNELANFINYNNSRELAEINNIQVKIDAEKRKLVSEKNDVINKLTNDYNERNLIYKKAINSIDEFKDNLERMRNLQKDLQERKKELYTQYDEVKAKKFDENESFCPTCFQKLKANQIKVIQEEFETNIKKELVQIQEKGKKINKEIQDTEASINNYTEALEKAENNLAEHSKNLSVLEKEIEISKNVACPTTSEEIEKLEKKLEELNNKIQKPDETQKNRKSEILLQKVKTAEKLEELNKVLMKNASNSNNVVRIDELMQRERQLAQQLAELEQTEFATQEFIKTKVALVESKVAEKFPGVKFKLFKTLVNGAVEEVCETTVGGVPFGALSNGAQIKCGLTIIDALQKHYGIEMPIFIDNAEGVTKDLNISAQLIKMFAMKGEEYKSLDIKYV